MRKKVTSCKYYYRDYSGRGLWQEREYSAVITAAEWEFRKGIMAGEGGGGGSCKGIIATV